VSSLIASTVSTYQATIATLMINAMSRKRQGTRLRLAMRGPAATALGSGVSTPTDVRSSDRQPPLRIGCSPSRPTISKIAAERAEARFNFPSMQDIQRIRQCSGDAGAPTTRC
jgi:hypothetical protein